MVAPRLRVVAPKRFAFCLFCVNFGIRFGYRPLTPAAKLRKSFRLRQLLAFTATWLPGP